jgi:hypothetical protein
MEGTVVPGVEEGMRTSPCVVEAEQTDESDVAVVVADFDRDAGNIRS